MWQPLAGCQNCDQQVHKPQFAVNALCHLSFTLKIKAPFFAAGSISPTPGMYFFKTAKSQTFSTTCGSSHQPMAISRTILFTRNFKTSFYHILLTSVTHGSVYNSREHILKNIWCIVKGPEWGHIRTQGKDIMSQGLFFHPMGVFWCKVFFLFFPLHYIVFLICYDSKRTITWDEGIRLSPST